MERCHSLNPVASIQLLGFPFTVTGLRKLSGGYMFFKKLVKSMALFFLGLTVGVFTMSAIPAVAWGPGIATALFLLAVIGMQRAIRIWRKK